MTAWTTPSFEIKPYPKDANLGFVYVVEGHASVKIGHSRLGAVRRRIAAIQSTQGLAARAWLSPAINGFANIERVIHADFAAHRTHGEFFSIPFDDAVAAVSNRCRCPVLSVSTQTPLHRARLAKNLTLQELADRVHVDRGNLSRIERGKLGASARVAERLAGVLGISELEILYPERFLKPQQDQAA